MRENRLSGSEGGGIESNRFSLPLSGAKHPDQQARSDANRIRGESPIT
jgi:hypothetical protein